MFILLIFACTKFPDNLKAVFRDVQFRTKETEILLILQCYSLKAANKILEVYICFARKNLTSIIKRLLNHRRKFEDYGTEQQVGSMGFQVYYS